MSYHYEVGAVRWKRWLQQGDPRAYQSRKGWSAQAMVIDEHPITSRPLKQSQWWIREEYEGDLS